jgi:5'-nucleotidase
MSSSSSRDWNITLIVEIVIVILCGVFSLMGFGFLEPHEDDAVHLRIIALNDFHGHLYDGQQLDNRSAGSAPVLASRLKAAMQEENAPPTIIALLGDMAGASPRNTSLLMDEPTILFFNMFAGPGCSPGRSMQCSSCNVIAIPGNHEFNRGTEELLRMTYGGNGKITVPRLADPYPGAMADTICANVVWKENGTPVLPPGTIREVDGVPVAFIGAVTTETKILELPENIRDVEILNESEAINRYVAELQGRGIHAFVVLIHNGGIQEEKYTGPTRTGGNVTGPVVPIISALDPDVDVVLTAHSHQFTNAYLKNAGGRDVLVTEAYSYGMGYADLNLTIDRRSRDIVGKSASIVPVYADDPLAGAPDPAAAALVAGVRTAVGQLENEVIAMATANITREPDASCGGSALGELVADSQRAAMDADVAFVTTGNVAGSLHADIDQGEITWADLEAVLPPDASLAAEYGGWYSRPHVATRELSGDQIKKILERQGEEPVPAEYLSVSGIEYTCDLSRPAGDQVTEMRINGEPVMAGRNYTAAMNYYMAYGMGGNYSPSWDWGDEVVVGPADIDALAEYIRSRPGKWTR